MRKKTNPGKAGSRQAEIAKSSLSESQSFESPSSSCAIVVKNPSSRCWLSAAEIHSDVISACRSVPESRTTMQPVRPLGHGMMVSVSPSSCFISAGIAAPISGLKFAILLKHELKTQRRISTCHTQGYHLGGSGFDWASSTRPGCHSLQKVRFGPISEALLWPIAARHKRQKSANSCLSESAEVATKRSSPRSSIIMPAFGMFIGRLIHGQKR